MLTRITDPATQPPALVRYADDAPTVIEVPEGRLLTAEVNRAGVVAGASNTGSDPVISHVWVYRDGALHDLSLPEGFQTVQNVDINGRGDVVATVCSGDRYGVALWPAAAPDQPRLYPTDRGAMSRALAATDPWSATSGFRPFRRVRRTGPGSGAQMAPGTNSRCRSVRS